MSKSYFVYVAITLTLLVGILGSSLSLLAGPQSEAEKAADAAVYLSELESQSKAERLYSRMHSEAQALIPESAVVGWYEQDFFPLDPQPISRIVSVEFVNWTWGVTGKTYTNTAEVSFVQPFGSGANVAYVEETVRLVKEGGRWKWFFGRSAQFVNEQISRFPSSSQSGGIDQIPRSVSPAGEYTLAISCSHVDAVVEGVVYAYCDWPFAYSAPFYCVRPNAISASGSGMFLCNTSFTRDLRNPEEVKLDFAPKLYYPIEVTCEVSVGMGNDFARCNPPVSNRWECVLNESRFAMPYEKFLLCRT